MEVIRCQVRTIRRMTHQIDVLSAQKCRCLSWCVRARIVVVKSDPSSAVGFSDFLEANWQTNGCVPLRIDCSALFQWYDGNMSSFFEKTGAHLLGSASCASNFCWIWLILKHPYSRLLFSFGLIQVNSWFITCHDFIKAFRSAAIVFLWSISFPQSTRAFFWAIGKLCGIQCEQIFFDSQMFMQYWMYMLVPLIPKVVSISL